MKIAFRRWRWRSYIDWKQRVRRIWCERQCRGDTHLLRKPLCDPPDFDWTVYIVWLKQNRVRISTVSRGHWHSIRLQQERYMKKNFSLMLNKICWKALLNPYSEHIFINLKDSCCFLNYFFLLISFPHKNNTVWVRSRCYYTVLLKPNQTGLHCVR